MPSNVQLALVAAVALSSGVATAFPVYNFNAAPTALHARQSTSSPSSLRSCLSNSGGYDLSYQSSSDYSALASSYNPIFDYKPLVIAVPETEAEVASIVKCVSAEGGKYKLSPRSGGHSYEAYSLGGQDGSVVVDLRHLNTVNVNHATNTADVGAGVRLGTLAQEIWNQGRFALPHGTCPMVGVSGHALGGGFGFTTRAWGYLLDRITQMRIVDHTGTLLTVNKHQNPDLWWALRGGGANNFGIVTQFSFSLLAAPTQILNYAYTYKSNQDCANAIVALQSMTLAPSASAGLPAEFGGELLISGSDSGDFNGNSCQLSGQHINTSRKAHDDLISGLHKQARIQATSSNVKPFSSWIDSLTDIMGSLNVTGRAHTDHEQFYAKSLVQPLTATYTYTSALSLVNKLNSYAGLEGTGNGISFDFLGPLSYPVAKVDAADSSFNAHQAAFVYQFYSYGFPGNDDAHAQQVVWKAYDDLVDTAKSSDEAAEWGAYVNYVDSRQKDWGRAYYAGGLERLKALKTRWDPQTVFDFPQSLAHA